MMLLSGFFVSASAGIDCGGDERNIGRMEGYWR